MTSCFKTIHLKNTSAAKITCLFPGSGHNTPDLDIVTNLYLVYVYK